MAEPDQTRENACTKAIPARYVLAILASIGMAIVYGLKVNLGVAMVGMVNNTAITSHNSSYNQLMPIIADKLPQQVVLDECPATPDESQQTSIEDGPFEWSTSIQGALKSAYFWGYLVAQIPGGRIAELYSAKWVMFFSVAINVVCTLLSPISAKLHYGAFIFIRAMEGIGGGVTFPSMHVMLASWAPPNERSVMSSIVYAGTSLGTVVFTLVTGLIAAKLGWEAIFYIQGAVSAVWLILWALLIADTPRKQTLISEKERHYIISSLSDPEDVEKAEVETRKPPFPWRSVITSVPFWAILIAHTCSNWGWYMVLIELPNYMKSVLKLKIAENAVLSSLPFLTMWIFSLALSKTLDTLRSRSIITTTGARKLSTAIASVGPLLCFLALCYIGCMRTLAILLMTLAVTSVAGMFCGYLSNHIDIAPNFAGTLIALTNTVATIPGIIVPIFVGHLTETDPSIHSWRIIFWVTIVLYVVEAVVFCLFASGEEQKWNKYNKNEPGEEQPLKSFNKTE